MITLSDSTIHEIFLCAKDQHDYFLNLYKVAFPDFDRIKKIDGYPLVNKALHEKLFENAIEFDKKYHPHVISGGLWLSVGFSCDDSLPDNTIDVSKCNVTYKGAYNE